MVAVEFQERLTALATKIKTQRDSIKTEEATKNAFVMPFISTILGYDVFNPMEVVPEFIADVGMKGPSSAVRKPHVNGNRDWRIQSHSLFLHHNDSQLQRGFKAGQSICRITEPFFTPWF